MQEETTQKKIDHLTSLVEALAGKMAEDFYQMNQRFDAVDNRLDRIEAKITGLGGRVEVLEDIVRMVRTKLNV